MELQQASDQASSQQASSQQASSQQASGSTMELQQAPDQASSQRPAKSGQKYCFEYINNDSKRWDGKQVLVNDEWLETLYKPEELTVGKKLRIPYPVKRSSEVVYWNAVLVDPQSAKPVKANTKKTKGNAIHTRLVFICYYYRHSKEAAAGPSQRHQHNPKQNNPRLLKVSCYKYYHMVQHNYILNL